MIYRAEQDKDNIGIAIAAAGQANRSTTSCSAPARSQQGSPRHHSAK
jgi:hypothetical protein